MLPQENLDTYVHALRSLMVPSETNSLRHTFSVLMVWCEAPPVFYSPTKCTLLQDRRTLKPECPVGHLK